MDLSGTWRAALADDDLRRGPSGSTTTTTGGRRWPSPGTGAPRRPSPRATGRCSTAPASSSTPGRPGARHWVVLDGVFYQADVFLDGAYLGDPEGYFFPHSYEITDLARLAPEHVLAVEVACARRRTGGPSAT